jgi:2-polyprenyl-3-methyl-5-hydroxy-6-metoxy-1,4-benzoquinol methylase
VSDDETLKVYAAQARDYAAKTDAINAGDPLLAEFIAAVRPDGHVLDLGCGPGASAEVMARAGLRVTATDATAEMVELAAQRPGVTARLATFDEIDGADIFDGIWANFSLLHAPRADLPRHLGSLHRAIKPGGRFHIVMKTGTGSHRDQIGRQYTYVTPKELRGLLTDAGFSIVSEAAGRGIGLDGTPADWIALAANG